VERRWWVGAAAARHRLLIPFLEHEKAGIVDTGTWVGHVPVRKFRMTVAKGLKNLKSLNFLGKWGGGFFAAGDPHPLPATPHTDPRSGIGRKYSEGVSGSGQRVERGHIELASPRSELY
jgi:hypothetical protein